MMSEQNIHQTQLLARENAHQAALAFSGASRVNKMAPMELHVFLWDAALPTREEWQAGITEHGFPLTLDAALDVRRYTGFSPARYWGKKTGFEFNVCPAVNIAVRYKGISERIGTRGLSANFRWGGNALESVVVYIASAVLARLTDGILYYPPRNHFSTGHETLAMARRLIEAIELD